MGTTGGVITSGLAGGDAVSCCGTCGADSETRLGRSYGSSALLFRTSGSLVSSSESDESYKSSGVAGVK